MHTLEVRSSANECKTCYLSHFTNGTGGTPYYNAYFGVGTGPIYLDDVACTLSDSQLLECSSRPILSHNCNHHADAGVGCEGKCLSVLTLKLGLSKTLFFFYSSVQYWSSAINGR